MKTLIKNIKEIVGISINKNTNIKSGNKLNEIASINDGWIMIDDNSISDFGSMKEWQGVENWNETEIIDADNGIVLPSWCDSHTHIVYAGSREIEFLDKINGLSYEEIAKRGGGILNSAQLLNKTSEDNLYIQSAKRVDQVIKLGTGALEIKSGYGLDTENEIKIARRELRVLGEIK